MKKFQLVLEKCNIWNLQFFIAQYVHPKITEFICYLLSITNFHIIKCLYIILWCTFYNFFFNNLEVTIFLY